MDKEKIYEAAKTSLSKDIVQGEHIKASMIIEAISKAIVSAFEEYDRDWLLLLMGASPCQTDFLTKLNRKPYPLLYPYGAQTAYRKVSGLLCSDSIIFSLSTDFIFCCNFSND